MEFLSQSLNLFLEGVRPSRLIYKVTFAIGMKLVLLDAETLGDLPDIEELRQFGELKTYKTTAPQEVVERISDADIVLTNKVILSRDILQQAKNIKMICILATGTNNIDLKAAEELNIHVKNVAGYSTHSVAQHTFAMLFNLIEHLHYYDNYVKSGGYSKSPVFTHLDKTYFELKDKVFGIVGLGSIGRRVAEIATAFGAKVIYYSTSGKNYDDTYERVGFDTLLNSSDVISIHAPLNDATTELIDRSALDKMKSTAYLLNLGRGGIVNEADLIDALNNGIIAGAGLDVLEKEPMISDHVSKKLNAPSRLLITPHIAWASIEARTELMRLTIRNIKAHLSA